MKRLTLLLVLLLPSLVVKVCVAYEGFGEATVGHLGDEGWTTVHVTNTNNSGAGSLREALSAGSRLIVFDVGGTIALTSNLAIAYDYITIDGSTAPSPGITITTARPSPTVNFYIVQNSNTLEEIIVKYLRFDGLAGRRPDSGGGDLMGMNAETFIVTNVVVDHCTFRRAQDGALDTRKKMRNVTVSNCFFYDCPLTTIINGNDTVDGGIHGMTMCYNVWARGNSRQPYFEGEVLNFNLVNNVVYGCGWYGGGEDMLYFRQYDGDPNPDCEVIKNYYAWPTTYWATDQEKSIIFYNPSCPQAGNVTFTSNIFPVGETDDVSKGTPTVIPAGNQPPEFDANTLGDNVVPTAGTQFPLNTELILLDEISRFIGGAGVDHVDSFLGTN